MSVGAFQDLIFWMLAGSGDTPSLDNLCPRQTTVSCAKEHLAGFNFNPAFPSAERT